MKTVFRLILSLVVVFIVTSVLAVIAYKWLPVKVTPLMVIRAIQHRDNPKYIDWSHRWVPLDSISPYLPVAVMASEDQNFMHHHGFDFGAIQQAYEERVKEGRRRGASTISHQTAKNVFLWPTSSWVRKGLEAYFTVLIETFWSKQRIMEVYLNSIETGPGIYGAEGVANDHFNCHANQLSRSDCALIAATLPNPIRFSSHRPSGYVLKRQHQIKMQMKYIDFMPKGK